MEDTVMDSTFSSEVELIEFNHYSDERGLLLPVEFDNLPFIPKRIFTVSKVMAGTVRGQHAHAKGQQLLICLQGKVEIKLKNKNNEACITLYPGGKGLLIKPYIWAQQTYLTDDSSLLVLASEVYDKNSYIYDLKELR